MIGGTDVVVPIRFAPEILDACLRSIITFWPQATFEDAITCDRFDHYLDIPLGRVHELLVYENAVAAQAWEQLGAVPALNNTMIHLLIGPKQLTVVVDNPQEPDMERILGEIVSASHLDLFDVSEFPMQAAA